MTTLLVTGGAGFIGSCFVRHVLKKHPDYKIINLDALTYCGNIENLKDIESNPNYTFVHGNICDKNLARELIEQSDCVINFAAESHVDNSIKNPPLRSFLHLIRNGGFLYISVSNTSNKVSYEYLL